MYKRLIILSVIIFAAFCGLTLLGYHAVEKWAEGLEWKRVGEFAEVAEQVRQDVKRKLDQFVQTEAKRPYTHYQYYYVPNNVAPGQQQMPVLRSPLSGRMENYLAYGYFQIEPDGSIVTANDDIIQKEGETVTNTVIDTQTQLNRKNIKDNLLPALNGMTSLSFEIAIGEEAQDLLSRERGVLEESADVLKYETKQKKPSKAERFRDRRGKNYPIESLQVSEQKTQTTAQSRSVIEYNIGSNVASPTQQALSSVQSEPDVQTELERMEEPRQTVEKESSVDTQQTQLDEAAAASQSGAGSRDERTLAAQRSRQIESFRTQAAQPRIRKDMYAPQQLSPAQDKDEMVPIQTGPLVTWVVGGGNAQESIFGGQVFLIRDVQIEDRRFRQGFQLNEKRLIEDVENSANQFMREGMSFELSRAKSADAYVTPENQDIAYTAILDFGFGDLLLNLRETDPAWIGKQVRQLHNWYFSIIVIVLLAVTLGLASLWRNARAQLKLAQKKDDFISAVSHELRTPLTSIRMYSEMLENRWVKSEDKLAEYYASMRQESERLSRLIENVLDFSRIQKGRKKYAFSLGNLNECVADVVEMMKPYAAQSSFTIKTDLEPLGQTAFDTDAVKQIVVNLLDNAIKYARDAEDKTITVRTRGDRQFILIEVEDRGPGVPHRQRKKVFEEFYRTEAEATRETAGTGLGLALVKKFAQAHNGFVEILTAKPSGAIFRVTLAVQM